MKKNLSLLFLIFLFSCSAKKEEKVTITKNNTYKQSEMAALMLQMYAVNLGNKKMIVNGVNPNNLEDFSKEFEKIYTAKLTDSTDRNDSFNAFSNYHLSTYKQIFSAEKDALIKAHNNTINSCIACHKTTCIGPIPRIKKLLIQ